METAPLRSGALVPTHPADTTSLKITSYGKVYDDADGRELMAGLHRTEIVTLQAGQRILENMYRYAYVPTSAGCIIVHTRGLVTIEVTCADAKTN